MPKNNKLWPISKQEELSRLIEKASGKKPRKITYPWEYLDLLDEALSKIRRRIPKDVQISKLAVVEGKVTLEPGVRIFEGAKVRGPAYIGKNTIIGNGSLVRESIIGESCVVGYCTEIARSLIGSPSWFHTNYVGDSIFDGDISMGSGAITANLRLDEAEIVSMIGNKKIGTKRNKLGCIVGAGTRFGVNAVPMPGIKIGQNSFVGAGVVLNQDLPDGSFCAAKQELKIAKNRTRVTMDSRSKFRKKV
jgi:bifunctional UDP-N-acetylglucosamine pyrophosphorylase/glucosamine-1-phosphate N-acetyltransferase